MCVYVCMYLYNVCVCVNVCIYVYTIYVYLCP